MSVWASALFQPIGSEGYDVVCHIDDRDKVYKSLGLYSDYLNWNTQPDVERCLRKVLCEIYGHAVGDKAMQKFTWKPLNVCYWCFEDVGYKA